MGLLSGLIGVVFLVYLLLRIAGMVGGNTRTTVMAQAPSPGAELWKKSASEIQVLLDEMPTAWVTYEGTTPALKLKIRGLSGDLYQVFVHKTVDAFGRESLARLPYDQMVEAMHKIRPNVNAEAYVLNWTGAQYPNGKPLPFNSDNLASFMRKDEMLTNFIADEAGKLADGAGLKWE